MANEFEYNAPQFRNFNDDLDDSDGADTFFDVESDEPPQMPSNEENKENQSSKDVISVVGNKGSTPVATKSNTPDVSLKKSAKVFGPLSVIKSECSEIKATNLKQRNMLKAVRRISAINNNMATEMPVSSMAEKLSKDLDKLSVKAKRRTVFEGIPLVIKQEKEHIMTTRNDQAAKTPTIDLRTRVINKEDEPSRKRKSEFGGHRVLGNNKYMAMAEQILHFQKDTPPRFHTNRRRSSIGSRSSNFKARQSYNPRRTIALTPKLMTKLRSRVDHIPSQQEKEEMELEEMKKQQVKANPLNAKIFQPPKPPRRSERPITVQEPFHITEVFKKPAAPPSDEPYKFTARPVPKVILQRPVGVGVKPELPITVPQSPAITKSARFQKPVRVAAYSNDNKESTEDLISFGVPYSRNHRKTEVKPFSFEVRDKEMIQKKEKKIQEILEAEKKAREFKANPLPTFKAPKETNRSSKHNNLDCSKSSTTSLVEENYFQFKARPAKVLQKTPFEPKLDHTHSEPMDVQLFTERRAQERQEFEMKQMEKEERLALLKEMVEMEKKEREEAEIARIRKETVHKAQPMPKFKTPVQVKVNLPLTNPQSPRFSKRTRKNNVNGNDQPN